MYTLQTWQLASKGSPEHRFRLANFWLSAPEDQLEFLWSSHIGEITRDCVRSLTPSTVFSNDQTELREELNSFLSQGLDAPGSVQVLLATFLFSPAGLLTIQGPERYLPTWLLSDYHALYSQSSSSPQPQVFESPQAVPRNTSFSDSNPSPDFGVFPSSLQELQSNRLQLNRMLGLANLYYIDPEDKEISSELRTVREQFSRLVFNSSDDILESLWSGELGDRYWAIVRSGIQKESLSTEEESLKNTVTQKLSPSMGGGFGQSGSIQAMIVAMLYFEPGSMKVDGADQKVPLWLLSGYKEIFEKSIDQPS